MKDLNNAECRHCKRTRLIQGRGLCHRCYDITSIRREYPTLSNYNRAAHRPEDYDPTEAEIEHLIETQLRSIPGYKPFPGPPDDPKYNKVVDQREHDGFPARHPMDHKGVKA